ncbi:MAG: GntR family transcriptional regulator [Ilumatobacteraceae bacterium]|nr:GntR family transcriptional regulator [Ilumatobacteraceae bacterium]
MTGEQLRQPRLAELIAGILRDRIMAGEYSDGDFLPKQEQLLTEFRVSKPSVREALRVLETEGLIDVRRGNQGGAIVHRPQPRDAAYMLGLVLQNRSVSVADVGRALVRLEPACAGLCAARPDRVSAVERLSEIHRLAEESLMDDIAFVGHMRRFHEVLVDECGNETMKAVVGVLEVLWSTREHAWAQSAAGTVEYPGREIREAGLRAHARIVDLIAAGDSSGVIRLAGSHLAVSQIHAQSGADDVVVDATDLRATTHRPG